jgi:ABC-2 type transport system permease protein
MRAFAHLVEKSLRSGWNATGLAREQAKLKLAFISCFSAGWLASLGWLFYQMFDFLHRMGGVGFVLIPKMFSLFFFGLGCMLVVSGGIAAYSGLYQSREMRALLTSPIPVRDLLYYKFSEAALLSSWAFFFIILPFIGAYAAHRDLGGWIAVWTLSFSLPFVMVCSGLGVLLVMLLVRWAPRRRWFSLLCLTALAAVAWWLFAHSRGLRAELVNPDAFAIARMIPGYHLASHPLLPSHWLAEGVMALTRGQWTRGFLFWACLASSLGVLLMLVGKVGEWVFYEGYQRSTVPSGPSRPRAEALLPWLEGLLPFRAPDVRAFLVKDARIFLRDPAQWSQALIFLGLLSIYFLNIRGLRYDRMDPDWRGLVGFLNVFSLSAVMCSLSARFVYPQLSLEGQSIWVVGLSPSSMTRVLRVKFWTSLLWMLVGGVALTWMSGRMLRLDPEMAGVTVALIALNCLALAGLANGLGALYLDTEVKSPSAIISGFGGTLNLVLGLLIILLNVLPATTVMHLASMGRVPEGRQWPWLGLALGGSCVLSLLFAALPLRLGRRHLETRDY